MLKTDEAEHVQQSDMVHCRAAVVKDAGDSDKILYLLRKTMRVASSG